MKHRFEVLDIFRGAFAVMVFLFHLNPFAQTPIINNEIVNNSDMFVDFFFVLSGFVISYNYENIYSLRDAAGFFKKRFLRIYPLHLLMLLAFLSIEFIKTVLSPFIQVNNLNNPNNNIFTFITSLFLINSVKISNVKDVSWNPPSWSISAEMIAYLVFAVIILLINKLNLYKYRCIFYLGVVFLGILTLASITNEFRLDYTYNFGFLRGIIGFFFGLICCNTFLWLHSKPLVHKHDKLFSVLETVILVLLAYVIYYGPQIRRLGFLYETLFFICIIIFSFEKGFISNKLKKLSILKTLGKYSYSIYMTHALLISLFNVLFIRIVKFEPSDYSYLFILNFTIIYLVSAFTYKYIEMYFYSSKGRRL